MHPDLEAIVAADEESRARVTLAEERARMAIEAARADADRSIAARRAAAQEALDRELEIIRREGEQRVDQLRQQQSEYLRALNAAGERNFAKAVRAYREIVCGAADVEVTR